MYVLQVSIPYHGSSAALRRIRRPPLTGRPLLQNLTGPQVFLAKEAPGYRSGIIAMLACYVAAIVLIFVYYLWIVRLNRQKAKFLEEHPEVLEQNDLLDEWHDATDFENPKFVYVM